MSLMIQLKAHLFNKQQNNKTTKQQNNKTQKYKELIYYYYNE